MNQPTQPSSAPDPNHYQDWLWSKRSCDVSADINCSTENILEQFKGYGKELSKYFNIEI